MFAAAFMNRRDRSGAPAEKSLSSLRCVENKATTAIFLALIDICRCLISASITTNSMLLFMVVMGGKNVKERERKKWPSALKDKLAFIH